MNPVKQIIEDCGGRDEVAYRLKIHHATIWQWERKGIPEREWDRLIEMAPRKVTPGKLHSANKEVRKARASSPGEG